MNIFLKHATKKECVFRAIRVAIFIGTLLNIINHWDAVYYGTLTSRRVYQMLITYLVPYCVSTYSSAMQARSMELNQQNYFEQKLKS